MRLGVGKYQSLEGVGTVILTAEISGLPYYCFRISDVLQYLALLTIFFGKL